MTHYRDYNGVWRIRGHERHEFSTEKDAQTAIDYAIDLSSAELYAESNRRRRAKVKPELSKLFEGSL